MVIQRKTAGSAFLLFLAIPFLGVGLFMGWLAWHTVQRGRAIQDWVERPARILEAGLREKQGDDSTTYQVTARYAYEVDGRSYQGTRVGLHRGSDNIGSWHQEKYAVLQEARAGQRALTCRVNPADPDEAILFPEVRRGMVLFYMLFAVVFGGAGTGLLIGGWASVRQQRYAAAAPVDQPWRQRRDWAEGMIRSNARLEAWILAFTALIWNGIAWPICLTMGGTLLRNRGPALLFFLFPVLGLVVAAVAVRHLLVARRYGRAVFQMAPVPGVLGGRLAGLIRLPESARPPDGFEVTVKCQRTTHQGKHTSTTTLWEDRRRLDPEVLPLVDTGQALPVLFALPYTLPPSLAWEGSGTIRWWLDVKGRQPGVDVVVKFEIPVFQTAASRQDFVLDESSISAYEMKNLGR